MTQEKMRGEQRREDIIRFLRDASQPVTGSDLADRAQVSRQVIVQDMALLKARDEPILATPRGYVYQSSESQPSHVSRVIACRHRFEQTEEELNILVDHGVHVRDVIVEHPFYGELKGSLMLRSREDVRQFIEKLEQSGASLLASLTDGVHLHTLEAPSPIYLEKACKALEEADILLGVED